MGQDLSPLRRALAEYLSREVPALRPSSGHAASPRHELLTPLSSLARRQDLKPSNLLLDRWGALVVADFGISTKLEGTLSRFMPSSVVGTTYYMAPEAFDPEKFGGLGPPSDVWSMACCIFEMSTGLPPWNGERFQVRTPRRCARRQSAPAPADLLYSHAARGAPSPCARGCGHPRTPRTPTAPPCHAPPVPPPACRWFHGKSAT